MKHIDELEYLGMIRNFMQDSCCACCKECTLERVRDEDGMSICDLLLKAARALDDYEKANGVIE